MLSNAKRNKRYLICPKPTQERPIAKRFSQDIFPSSVGFGCKGTTKFADVQILSGKSDCDKDLNKNTGLMDKEKIEHSTKVETIEEYLFTRREIAEG